jgi:hypothetical protein
MQRDGVTVRVRIGDAMQSKLIRHVGALILLIVFFRYDFQRAIVGVVTIDGRPSITCLFEAALEDFHDAVCVRMATSSQYGNGYEVIVQTAGGP